MSSRNKEQSDFDLETFIDLFDEILSSEDPRLTRAFQDLLIIATLVRSSDNKQAELFERRGPLRRLFDDVANINRRVNTLENQKQFDDIAIMKPGYGNYPKITITPNVNTTAIEPYISQNTTNSKLNNDFDRCSGEDC